jgi:hypothetical protein
MTVSFMTTRLYELSRVALVAFAGRVVNGAVSHRPDPSGKQGNESRLTALRRQRGEDFQEVLRVEGGAFAAALD